MAKTIGKQEKKAAVKVTAKKVKFPEKFTAQTIVNYISEKHELPRQKVKDLIEDLYDVYSEGILNGERVPMGKFGKAFIKVRPASKERMGRNPITGEEIKIAAKKATKVPKFSYSKTYKEQALKAKMKK